MIDSPASAHAPSAGKPHSAGWWIASCVGLALLAGLSLVNMFFMHLSPDSALHLIFARDLLEGLPRFETHLDNKGPMWTWIVTGMSLLTGPNFRAMAVLQVISYAIVAVTMYVGSVRFLDRRAATTAVLLWLILIHNPAMTGAGGRVEDLLVGVSALAWLCALRVTPTRFAFLGVLAGVAVMTKLTAGVAITLLAILSLIATDRSSHARGGNFSEKLSVARLKIPMTFSDRPASRSHAESVSKMSM